MNVEPGDLVQRILGDDVDWDIRPGVDRVTKRLERRRRHEHRSRGERRTHQQPANDKASFRNKQPARAQPLGIGQGAVVGNPRVVFVAQFDYRHQT